MLMEVATEAEMEQVSWRGGMELAIMAFLEFVITGSCGALVVGLESGLARFARLLRTLLVDLSP